MFNTIYSQMKRHISWLFTTRGICYQNCRQVASWISTWTCTNRPWIWWVVGIPYHMSGGSFDGNVCGKHEHCGVRYLMDGILWLGWFEQFGSTICSWGKRVHTWARCRFIISTILLVHGVFICATMIKTIYCKIAVAADLKLSLR